MPEREKLEKYLRKLKKEGIIKSIIFGLIITFSTITLFSLIFFIAHTKQVLITILLGILSCIAASIIVYNLKYKPTIKTTAKRVDELGLDERVVTMVDYLDKDEYIYQKQREDAIEKLDSVSEKSLKTRLSKPALVLLGVVMVLGLCSFALPNLNSGSTSENPSLPSSTLPPSIPDDSTLDEDDIIEELLKKLRVFIEKSAVDREFKDQLHVIVDQLEVELKQLETIDEKIDAIERTRKEIEKLIEEEKLRVSIGRSLMQSELTEELGNAILAAIADEDKIPDVAIAMINLKEKLRNSENYEEDLQELIDALTLAIETASKEKNEALVEAIKYFRDGLLNDSKQSLSIKKVKRLEKNDLDDIFDSASDEIQRALEKIHEDKESHQGDGSEHESQQGDDDALDDLWSDMNGAMQDAQDSLEGLRPDNNGDGSDDSNDSNKDKENGNDNNNSDDKDPSDKEGDGEGGENPPPKFDEDDLDSDTVIDGETPYLDVFDKSYEEILEYLAEHEDLPEDVRKAIEQYLEMLKA
ncbi:MAG: hypothetical protein J1F32_06655 [Erysipelotrichales bacterium]|nr:hypothetical protein [Erysipelotrichales bacterium]